MNDKAESDTSPDDREFTDEQLRAALERVGKTAREEAFQAGVPVIVLRDERLVWIYPDGREEMVDPPALATSSGDGR
jgi:hypothetical protein